MLLTKSKSSGGATASNVDELKKQASAAAVAKAVEVIKNGGTQAEAAAAAKAVARDILANGQKQMNQKTSTPKKGKKGLMGKLRKKDKSTASPKPLKPPKPTTAPKAAKSPSQRRLQRKETASPDPESITTGSRTDSRSASSRDDSTIDSGSSGRVSEDESSKGGASKNSRASSKNSRASSASSKSSKPSLYMEESVVSNEDMSLITDGNASKSTVHVTDLLSMGNVMNAIDKALLEQDIEREIATGKKHWMDRILDCEMCCGPEEEGNNSISSSGSGDGGTILSKEAPSVLSGAGNNNTRESGAVNSNTLGTVQEENEGSSDDVDADAAAKDDKDPVPSSPQPQSVFKNKSEAKAEVKQNVSWMSDGSIRNTAAKSVGMNQAFGISASPSNGDASRSTTSAPSPVPGASPLPVDIGSVNSKTSPKTSSSLKPKEDSKDDDSSRASPAAWKQLFGLTITPNKNESAQAAQSKTKAKEESQQQQQAVETRQDSTSDWRSMVTDEAPNPNSNRSRNRAPAYDPKRSNPNVFIPPTAQLPPGEVINFGTGYGSPMNHPGYGYGGPHQGQYYPNQYGNNPSSPYGQQQPFPNVTNHRSNAHGFSMSMDEASVHSSRVDRYGGDEAAMISDAAAKSKSKLDDAANFVYRVLSGDKSGEVRTDGTSDHQEHYNQHGGPHPMPYYPPQQQYQGQFSHQQQYPPQHDYHQNYPPQQQRYPPQQQYHPQQQYQQQNYHHHHQPSSAGVQVSSPMHNQRFAA